MTVRTSFPAVRRRVLLRAHPDLPLVDARAVALGAGTSAGLYLLLTGWLLPGVVEIVAELPVGARIGFLLLTSTATRFLAGWYVARRYRADHGLPRRSVALPSAALGGLAGYLLVVLLALLGGADVTAGEVVVDTLRWPLECTVGALIALPGPHHPTRRTT